MNFLSIPIMKRILIMFVFISCTIEAQVCRVSTAGHPLNSGASWDEPKLLQWALFDAQSCPEIWVKSGVYTQPHGASRSTSFEVQRGVKLFGGFIGTENSRDQRDPVNNKAILSGDIGVHGMAEDNSYNVVSISTGSSINLSSKTTIDGFVIRDGYATASNGGGLVCDANAANAICDPHLKNIDFINNIAANGGAIYFHANGGASRPLVENVQFIGNRSMNNGYGTGGAVFVNAKDGIVHLRFFETLFSNNMADENGGALAMQLEDDSDSEVIVAQSTFVENEAKNGGALYSRVYGSSVFPQVKTVIYDATFDNNSSLNRGGAIEHGYGSLTIENTTISDNASDMAGGGIFFNSSSTTYLNNVILWGNQSASGNQAAVLNATIYADNNVIQGGCGAIDVAPNTNTPHCQNTYIQNPLLAPLSNNSGFTQTRMPGNGGSAIDNGDNNTCTNLDQRGVSRPQNGQCDIGAVEVQTACRVTTNGTNNGNGSDWTSQAMTLQKALSDHNCTLIKVKKGTYYPTSSTDRTISFNVPAGVTLQGGFDGTVANENNPNPESNPVILSGDIGLIGDMEDNSYHVVKMEGHLGVKILPSTILSGIEIHKGFGSLGFFDYPNNIGAGLYCVGTGSGGECSPSLYDVKFVGNQALGGSGGGMFNDADNEGVSSPQLINVTFQANMAYNGGAMYNNGNNRGISSPIVINGRFDSNGAINSAGAVYNYAMEGRSSGSFLFGFFYGNNAAYGGAIYNSGQSLGSSNPSFSQTVFTNNSASNDGGAIYSAGWNSGQSKPVFEDVLVGFNSANRGGGMFLNDLAGNETAQINRVTFDQNTATDGGAIYNDGENGFSHPQLSNVSFHYNQATGKGGAIYNNGDNGASSPSLNHVTFKDNQAAYGAAMYSSGEFNGSSNASLRHVIMWNNTASQSGSTVYHNLAESSIYDSVIQYGCPTVGVGNVTCDNIIEADPLLGPLVDNGGFANTFLPAENSSAIDAGNSDYCLGEDQRKQSRPIGSSCDIGAIEVGVSGPTDVIFKDGFD